MNKKEFKFAMKVGLGRCYQALQQSDKEKYRDIVQWGCLHNLSFDTQSDGTPHEYVYRLVKCYDDSLSFLPALITKFLGYNYEYDDWEAFYLTRLLTCFAVDGAKTAKDALYQKYDQLTALLSDPHRRIPTFCDVDGRIWHYDIATSYFAEVAGGILSTDGCDFFVRLAQDVDKILNSTDMNLGDFDWLCYDLKSYEDFLPYVKAHTDKARKFISDFQKYLNSGKGLPSDIIQAEESDNTGENPRSAIRQTPDTRTSTQKQIDTIVSRERKKALDAMKEYAEDTSKMPISILARYLDHPDVVVSTDAQNMFSTRRDPQAIEYAKTHLALNGPNWWTLQVLIDNYLPENEEYILHFMRQLKYDYIDKQGWHAVVVDVTGEYTDHAAPLPDSILREAYLHSLCKCCRAELFAQLYERGALTELERSEAYHDAAPEIVRFAVEHHLKKSD